jgi:hypothetical protein
MTDIELSEYIHTLALALKQGPSAVKKFLKIRGATDDEIDSVFDDDADLMKGMAKELQAAKEDE